MLPSFTHTRIRTRILLALLTLTLIALLSFALISFLGMKNLGTYATNLNEGLGQEALRVSKNAMQNLARDGILRITIDQANLLDAEFRAVEMQVRLLAVYAENLWNNPGAYPRLPSYSCSDLPKDGRTVSMYHIPSVVAGNTVARDLQVSSSVDVLSKSIMTDNTFISSVTLATPTGLFRTFPWGGKLSPTFDARKLEWYTRAVATCKPGWSNPYPDPVGSRLRINCSKPVYDRGNRLVSVVGIDIDLKNINDRIARAQLNYQGIAVLLDQNRKVISKAGAPTGDGSQQAEYFHLDNTGEEWRHLEEALLAGKTGISQGYYQKRECLVAYAPVMSTKWSVLVILPVEDINAPIRPTERSIISQIDTIKTQVTTKISFSLVILTFVCFVMIGVVIVVARRVAAIITAPITTLDDGVKIIGEGNLDYRLNVHSGDEIEELANSFNKMTTDLQTYIRNLTETMAAKERIQGELKVATDIQVSLLPRIFPAFPNHKEFDIYAMMDPAKEVGGDFYDFFFIDERHLFFVIGDVSDKGVPAALFMMVSKTLLKTEAHRLGTPAEILYRVNNQLYPDNETMMFVTIFCAILDTDTGELTYSSAGHNPPLLCPSGSPPAFLQVPPCLVAGAMEDTAYVDRTIQLATDDIILLYTDGVTEAMNTASELFGEERLITVAQQWEAESVRDFIDAVRQDVYRFSDGATQSDDITMLAIKYNGMHGPEGNADEVSTGANHS